MNSRRVSPPPCIIPLVDTADMEVAVMEVTTLHRVITRRPWTAKEEKRGGKFKLRH